MPRTSSPLPESYVGRGGVPPDVLYHFSSQELVDLMMVDAPGMPLAETYQRAKGLYVGPRPAPAGRWCREEVNDILGRTGQRGLIRRFCPAATAGESNSAPPAGPGSPPGFRFIPLLSQLSHAGVCRALARQSFCDLPLGWRVRVSPRVSISGGWRPNCEVRRLDGRSLSVGDVTWSRNRRTT